MIVPSALDSVTVYAKGAVCTRVAKVTEAGVRQVRVTGLPLSLHAGSLRAKVSSGSGAARVLDVRPGYEVELAAETDVPAEQKALEAAATEVARLQHEHACVERELAELQKLRPVFPATKPGDPPRPAPVEALLKSAEFVSQELAQRFERRRALSQQLEDARNEHELRRKRVQEASASVRTQRARLSRVAVVTLSEIGAGELELSVEYFVPGARWAPWYALRLDPGMTSGALSMRAAIAQASGEDWSQVKLSLSTAALDRRTALPELKSLRIGRTQPPPARSGWREPPPGLDELFHGFDSAWRARPAPVPSVLSKSETVAAKRVAVARPPAPPAVRMPMPMTPPSGAPAVAQARISRSRLAAPVRGGFGGGGGDHDDVVVEAPSAELSLDELSEGAEAYDAPMEPEPAAAAEPQLELGAELLDYGNLFMAAPGAGRGRLQRAPDAGVAFLATLQVEVSVLMALVATSETRAAQVDQLRLPARAVAPDGGSFDYRYDCAARVDVPSKGEWTLVPVADADVGLAAEYACVPSVEPQVYRTVKLHNRSKHALLPGPIDVTLGDEFLLTADLPLIAPGEKDARLGLGVEEAIKVARKTHFKEGTGGLLGGSTVLPHHVEIELANRLRFPALVEVRERVPVSLDDDVKIEESKVEPPWEKDEGLRDGAVVRGARAWRVTVPPGQKTTLSAQYVVKIPSDKMVVGGNRRT